MNAELGRLGGKTSTRVFEVVIESGVSGPLIVIFPLLTAPFLTAAFYCAYLLVLIITAFVRSNVFFVFLDAVRPAPVLSFIARTAS